MPLRKYKVLLMIGLLLFCGGTAVYFWRESPDQKVPRLLRELRDLPSGKFEFFYFGRSDGQIQADFDRLGSNAVPALIAGLQDRDSTVRYLAAGQLGRIGDRQAVEPLIRALDDPDVIVQYWAISALGDIGDNRAVGSLIPLLDHQAKGVRFRAAQALGQIGDKRAYEPLLALRDDSELYPRAYAVEALGRLGDERALEVLSQILTGGDDSWRG